MLKPSGSVEKLAEWERGPSEAGTAPARRTTRQLVTAINPITAPACTISGLKEARTRLQRVYFPVLWHLLQCYVFWWSSFHMPPVRNRKQKGLKVSHLVLLLVVFKWLHGSEGVKRTTETTTRAEHRFPAPSSKLIQKWLPLKGHSLDRVSTRVVVVVVVVRELFSLVTSVICGRIRGRGQRLRRLFTTWLKIFVYCCVLTTVNS